MSQAQRAAEKIANDIHGRKGIGDVLDECDAETQAEMIATWAEYIDDELRSSSAPGWQQVGEVVNVGFERTDVEWTQRPVMGAKLYVPLPPTAKGET